MPRLSSDLKTRKASLGEVKAVMVATAKAWELGKFGCQHMKILRSGKFARFVDRYQFNDEEIRYVRSISSTEQLLNFCNIKLRSIRDEFLLTWGSSPNEVQTCRH
jgi:hypothetical protein